VLTKFRPLLASPLSRHIVLRIFLSIVVVEVVLLIPSIFRRQEELVAKFNTRAAATFDALQFIAPETTNEAFIHQVERLQANPLILGGVLYQKDGKVVRQFGELPTLPRIHYSANGTAQIERYLGSRYDTARSLDHFQQQYVLILRYDAATIPEELIWFIGRITLLVLFLSACVTATTMITLEWSVMRPIRQLQADLIKTGEAITQDQLIAPFESAYYQYHNELGQVIAVFQRMVQQILEAIAQRKNSESALSDSEAQLRAQANQLQITIFELKRTQSQLIQSEKMSSLGQMVAGIAHEINNPVNFISGNLKFATDHVADLLHLLRQYQAIVSTPPPELQAAMDEIDLAFLVSDLTKLLESMGTGATRIRDIVLSLRNFSRLDESEQKVVDLHEGLDSTLLLLQHRFNRAADQPQIRLVKDYDPLPQVNCYPGQLNQVFINILMNAIDALATQPEPVITIATESRAGAIAIRISDNGMGMTPEVQQRLFDPFFTTKPVGQGTGMGLAIAYQVIVETHKGKLICHSTVGQGSEFTIEIPCDTCDRLR
jgi:signal transduction histidine kinase